jgi:hypothetical protein
MINGVGVKTILDCTLYVAVCHGKTVRNRPKTFKPTFMPFKIKTKYHCFLWYL